MRFDKNYQLSDNVLNTYRGVVRVEENKKFYQKGWFVVLMLFIFFPVGLILMWANKNFNKTTRIVITSVIGVLIIIGAIIDEGEKEVEKKEEVVEVDKKEEPEEDKEENNVKEIKDKKEQEEKEKKEVEEEVEETAENPVETLSQKMQWQWPKTI